MVCAYRNLLSLYTNHPHINVVPVLGSRVQVPAEIVILNTIVLPHKEIAHSEMNKIIL